MIVKGDDGGREDEDEIMVKKGF